MNVAWKIEPCREGVVQVGKSKVALTNTEFKGKCHSCGKHGHKKHCPKKNKSEEEKRGKKFIGKCNQCGKVGQKATNCWEHDANRDKKPKNWKTKEEKEVGALNV